MNKLFIKNRKNKNISVLIEKTDNQKGLAFVMHGLGGFKEQPHIETFAKAFKDNNYTVIRFDTTNTFGESDGQYEDATTTNYYEDLEDVINWSKGQDFYQEPFVLCGHSLGAICSALYAENYSEKVKALAPISTVVSGQLSVEAHTKEEMDNWKQTGWRTTIGYNSGLTKKLKWLHMEDRLKYDLLKKVDKLIMPTILIVGELDTSTLPQHQQILFDLLPGKKEMHIIKNAPHTFREEEHFNEIYQILYKWIMSL
jgi:pimeloyl-ACP methyl ester carboxylesterase